MRYYVVGDDGQKYGPADLATLQGWIGEGRLLATATLEDEAGQQMTASAVPGLNFSVASGPSAEPVSPSAYGTPPPGAPGPYAQYPRAGVYAGDDGKGDLTQAWVFGVLGLFCCGLIFGALGIGAAKRAAEKGNPGANAARIFNIVVLVLWAIGAVVRIVMIARGQSGIGF